MTEANFKEFVQDQYLDAFNFAEDNLINSSETIFAILKENKGNFYTVTKDNMTVLIIEKSVFEVLKSKKVFGNLCD